MRLYRQINYLGGKLRRSRILHPQWVMKTAAFEELDSVLHRFVSSDAKPKVSRQKHLPIRVPKAVNSVLIFALLGVKGNS